MAGEDVEIRAGDSVLCGRLHRPNGPIRAVAVLHGATGVPARFYGAFADWLASDRHIACLTYDYRDFGASGRARGSRATMSDWGMCDQQAARDWAAATLPGVPLWVIGHSLGGMMLPFQRGLAGIDRVVCVASGQVHVSDHPWPYRAFAHAFWSHPMLWATNLLGHMPGKAFRIGHDVPAGVYRQWRVWCTSRGFHAADRALPGPDASALTCPVRMVAVADDALCPPAAVWRMMRAYPAAVKTQHVIRPKEVGLARVGHLDVLGAKGRQCWNAVMGEEA